MMYFFGFLVILSAAQAYTENGLLDSNSYYDDGYNSNSNYGNGYEPSMESTKQNFDQRTAFLDSNLYYDDGYKSNDNYIKDYETFMGPVEQDFDQSDYFDDWRAPRSPRSIRGIQKIGCFKDDKRQRALPQKEMLSSITNKAEALRNVKRCRDEAIKHGAHYFAIQNYDECWFGKKGDKRTQPFKYGRTPCPNRLTGGAGSQMVYRLIHTDNKRIFALPGVTPVSNGYVKGKGFYY